MGGGLEEKWVKIWEERRVFEADRDPDREKYFITFPFPYMDGPLHLGHAFTAARLDAFARYLRMKGYNVLFPWAWHWTGEAVAGISERIREGDERLIKILREVDGVPEEVLRTFTDPVSLVRYYTERNRKVAKLYGLSIDWRREFHTTLLLSLIHI